MSRLRRSSRALLVVLAAAAVVAAAAGAAAVGVVSGRIAIFSKSLTHTTCNLPGTSVSDDASTDENSQNATSGSAQTLAISPRSSRQRYAWLRFSLAACSLPANAQVDSATLTVNVLTAMSGRTVSVSEASATWAEGTITWANQPAVAATASGTFSAGSTGAKTIDVSPDVADWVAGAVSNDGWRLADLGAATTSNISATIGAGENPTAGNRPTLSITYAY